MAALSSVFRNALKASRRKHVHLVNDINLVLAGGADTAPGRSLQMSSTELLEATSAREY